MNIDSSIPDEITEFACLRKDMMPMNEPLSESE